MLLSTDSDSAYSASIVHNHDPAPLKKYNELFNQIDPRREQSFALREGECGLGQDFVRNEDIKHTAYFADISLAGDVRDSVHGVILDDELGRLTLSVQRGFNDDYFEPVNARRMNAILPIIKRHIRTSKIAACLSDDVDLRDGLFGCLLTPALQAIKIGEHPPRVTTWLDGRLSLTNDRLVFDNKRLKLAFLKAIAIALSGESASFRIDGTIFRFSPIAQQLEWLPHHEETVMFTVKQQKVSSSVPIFASSYEFTDQETRLLLSLTAGYSLRDCASHFGISYETIRWHVKNMCAKSGYHRSGEMIEAARIGNLSGFGLS